ncbi:phosphatase PAP2 family protein [Helicobacter typhlonius]|uniref:phosphatase PAP2 family protein n=1 Tax=Helicobacter typhlonius TaxID=76936 RepID=UPI002FE11A90
MKFCSIILLWIMLLTQGFSYEKSGFKIYGDVMLILPFAMMAYSYSIDDIQGVKQQAIGAGATLIGTHLIKQGFIIASRSNEANARISQRPNNGSFDGFPSGHTSFVFSSVGFAQKRYGWKWGLPLAAVATSVGISRIYAERHTTAQVISGAIFGFGTSYLLASKYQPKHLSLSLHTAIDGTPSYHLHYKKAF